MSELLVCEKPLIPNQPVNLNIRKAIVDFEEKVKALPGALIGDCYPLKHFFADGMYVRELTVPAGVLTITKIHKYAHPVFLMEGEISVLEEGGARRVKAPHHFITPAGTKRIVYHHSKVIIVTVHATRETDIKKIEDEIIAKTFEDISNIIDIKTENIKLDNFISEVTKKEIDDATLA